MSSCWQFGAQGLLCRSAGSSPKQEFEQASVSQKIGVQGLLRAYSLAWQLPAPCGSVSGLVVMILPAASEWLKPIEVTLLLKPMHHVVGLQAFCTGVQQQSVQEIDRSVCAIVRCSACQASCNLTDT